MSIEIQNGELARASLVRSICVHKRSISTLRKSTPPVADCEKGEDVAKKRYQDALEKDLPADVRAVVERQYQGVLQNHDRIRDLRDQHAATKS